MSGFKPMPEHAERNRQIVELRSRGATYAEIAEKLGLTISEARLCQIVAEAKAAAAPPAVSA